MFSFTTILALLLSFCSFSYEYLIIKEMQVIIGDGFVWRSLLVGVFVSFLGLGAYVQEYKKYKEYNLFKIEVILSSLGLLVPLVFYFSDNVSSYILSVEKNNLNPFFQYNFLIIKDQLFWYKLFFYFISFGWTALIGFFSGFEMPILMNDRTQNTNHILSFNYWGSLLASILSTYVFSSFFTVEEFFIFIALINTAVALAIQWKFKIKSFLVAIPLICLVIHLSSFQFIQGINRLYKFERVTNEVEFKDLFSAKKTEISKIETVQTKYQLINKVFVKEKFAVFLDGHFQFDSVDEKDYHETMVHVPLSLINKEKIKVLVLGGGDGLIVREILKHSNIEKINQVELDKQFFEYSKNDPDISRLNKKSLEDKRLNVIFDDAFSFLRNKKDKYDFIIIDFPYPYSYDLAKLYSIEFYTLIYSQLERDGFFVMDLPLYSKNFFKRKSSERILKKSKSINDILYSTIKKANFEYTHFYMLGDLEGYVLASKTNKIIDWDKIIKSEKISSINSKNLHFMKNEVPHDYSDDLVNSVFKSTILNFSDEIDKY